MNNLQKLCAEVIDRNSRYEYEETHQDYPDQAYEEYLSVAIKNAPRLARIVQTLVEALEYACGPTRDIKEPVMREALKKAEEIANEKNS